MLFEISYINKQGENEPWKQIFCGEEFEMMIHVMKYCSKKTSLILPQERQVCFFFNIRYSQKTV